VTTPDSPPVADANGPYLIAAGGTVEFDGTGTSDSDGDTLTYDWDFGDGSPPAPNAEPTPSHTYTVVDIYSVTLMVDHGYGGTSTDVATVVVYNPSGGFLTGDEWIDSPAGTYVPDPSLTGKAMFGFVSKYKKGAPVPTGSTEFQFQAGDLNFHSSSYDWLVVKGSNFARFKGVGTINGEGAYRFQIWAADSDTDTFRIRIWTEDGGSEVVVYDNGMNQPIGGGSIVIHAKKK